MKHKSPKYATLIFIILTLLSIVPNDNPYVYHQKTEASANFPDDPSPSSKSSVNLKIPLLTTSKSIAIQGDIVTIRFTDETIKVNGPLLLQAEESKDRHSFLVTGNGYGEITAGKSCYRVLGLDWSFQENDVRTVYQPWRRIELNLKDLVKEPAKYAGRLYLLEGMLTNNAMPNEPKLGQKTEESSLFKVNGTEFVWITNRPLLESKNTEEYALLLIEVRMDEKGWSLHCHRSIPAIKWEEPEFQRENVGNNFFLTKLKKKPIIIQLGDLISISVVQTRSSRSWYERKNNNLVIMADLTSERLSGSAQHHLLRAVAPGNSAISVYYQWRDAPAENVIYSVMVTKNDDYKIAPGLKKIIIF